MKDRTRQLKHTAGLVLAVICLASGLALPGYCWNQQFPSLSVTAAAATSGRNNPGILGQESVSVWSRLGPNKEIRALAIDPGNPNVIYAGSKSGLFKSTDRGATWNNTLVRDTLSLAIDFVNPNNLYAGTSSSGFAPGDPCLFKSTDGGASWSNSSSPVDFDFSLLVMDPTSPKTLYAGSEGQYFTAGGIILHKSTDGGTSWKDSGMGTLTYYGWAINPADPQILYAPGDYYGGFNVTDGRLFKSTDGGTSWSATGLTNAFVRVVAIDPMNPNTLYAGTTDYDYDRVGPPFLGLFKSTDSGNSWFAINNGLTDLIFTRSSVAALVIDPADPNILYAGTSGLGVFRSADGGASWSEFNPGLTNLGVKALAIDRIGEHLYAATGSGVFDFQYATPCADRLPSANQAFDFHGGTGFVNVTAGSKCDWTAVSQADWIRVTSGSSKSGSETVSYSVAPNESTTPRVGLIGIAARVFTVTQEGAPVSINRASVSGKQLFVFGENFDPGAVILRNGIEQNTRNDPENPKTVLIGKKAGKNLKPGDKLQVRNPNRTLSYEFTFTGS